MEFSVPEMSCGHCTAAIEKAIGAVDYTAKVDCDLTSRRVTIKSALDVDTLSAAIKDAGYDSEIVLKIP